MATAKKNKARAAPSPDRAAKRMPDAELEFQVYRTNGGRYTWEIVDVRGSSLAHSTGFASQGDAERAARRVQEGAGSARLAFDAPKQHQTVVA